MILRWCGIISLWVALVGFGRLAAQEFNEKELIENVQAAFQQVSSDDPKLQREAMKQLQVWSKKTSPAVLLALLSHDAWEIRAWAAWAVGNVREQLEAAGLVAKVIAQITPLLADTSSLVQASAARSLWDLTRKGIRGEPAIVAQILPVLASLLSDQDLRTRRVANDVLRRMHHNALPALPRLLETAGDKDEGVYYNNLEALQHLAEYIPAQLDAAKSKKFFAMIEATLHHPKPDFRIVAVYILRDFGMPLPQAQAGLLLALQDQKPTIREHAAKGLVKIGHDPQILLPALEKAMSDNNSKVRREIVRVLSNCGLAALPLLTKMLQDANANTSEQAAQALCKVCWNADAASVAVAIAPLLEFAQKAEAPVAIAQALSALGERAKPAIGPIAQFLENPEWVGKQHYFVSEMIQALRKIGTPQVAQLLRKWLTHDKPEIKIYAAQALWELEGDKAYREVLPILMEYTQEGTWWAHRIAAISGLYKIGKQAAAVAVGPLQKVLTDTKANGSEKAIAARALGQMGDLTSIPLLLIGLQDTEADLQAAAARALGNLGKATPEVIAALATACKSDNEFTVLEAAQALWTLQGERSLPQILPAVQAQVRNQNHGTVCAAIALLGKIQSPQMTELLHVMMQKGDMVTSIQVAIAQVLWTNAGERVLPEIMPILEADLKFHNRFSGDAIAIANLLATIGPKAQSALPTLKMVVREELDLEVIAALQHAIARISEKK